MAGDHAAVINVGEGKVDASDPMSVDLSRLKKSVSWKHVSHYDRLRMPGACGRAEDGESERKTECTDTKERSDHLVQCPLSKKREAAG